MGNGQALLKSVQRLKQNGRVGLLQSFGMRKSSDQQLFITFPDGTDLGYCTEKLATALKTLYGKPQLEFEALASLRILEDSLRSSGKAADATIRVSINVYGSEEDSEYVGTTLSGAHLFLQDPEPGQLRQDTTYKNPHIMEFSNSEESENESTADDEDDFYAEPEVIGDKELAQEVAEVFGSLKRDHGLRRLQENQKIKIDLFE